MLGPDAHLPERTHLNTLGHRGFEMPFRLIILALVISISTVSALPIPASANTAYDATVDQLFHGLLEVTDINCHRHSLSIATSGGVSRSAFDAWGAHHYNIHVVAHQEGVLEYADEIYPRDGSNAITKCAAEEQSFNTHIDGTMSSWSEGNAIGGFVLMTSNGATRHFGFLAGQEPKVNGHKVFCENGPDPMIACDALTAYITFGHTKIRVYYKIVDGADGPSDQVTSIQTL